MEERLSICSLAAHVRTWLESRHRRFWHLDEHLPRIWFSLAALRGYGPLPRQDSMPAGARRASRQRIFPIVITLTVSRDVCHGLNLAPMVYLNTVTVISDESEATAMLAHNWSKSEFEYGRKFLHSALEGARCGEEAFLKGRPLSPFLGEGFRDALKPAAVGACIGLLSSYPGDHRRSIGRALAFSLVGWLLGLGAGVAWKTRGLTECVAGSALSNIGKVRDEHWLERHPIDYA